MTNPVTTDQEHVLKIAGRLSYCDAFEPRVFKNKDGTPGKARYKTQILVPKEAEKVGGVSMGGPEVVAAIKAAMKALKLEKFPPPSKVSIPQGNTCFKNGDATDEDGEPATWVTEESPNHFIFTCSESDAPTTLDRRARPTEKKDGLIYSGAYAIVIVKLWIQNNEYGKKINANFKSVQFVAHGEPFGEGGGTDGSEFLSSLDDDDDDSGFDDLGDDDGDLDF